MHLYLLGVSHRTAPVDLRERIDFATKGVESALNDLATRAVSHEAVVLSTCNRAEIYTAAEDVTDARHGLVDFLSAFHQVPAEEIQPHLYEKTDREAVQHLFRVAAGLDSLVIGEPQILGQVKEAFALAARTRLAGQLLNKLFNSSFSVGKRVRTETGVAEGAVSVSFAAVALARKIFGQLKGRQVLVIGAGEMGKLTALHLKTQGIERMLITSRTAAHAAALAAEIEAQAIPWERMTSALGEVDIAITATGATLPILSRTQVEQAIRPRKHRPLFLIDIAVPRDVDSAVAELDNVFLYNIDDLQAIVRENMNRRAAEIVRAEAIIGEEVDKFLAWQRARGAVPTVVALRQRFDTIRRSELDRLQPKLQSLSDDGRARVDEVTRLIVEKLLLAPTEQLKAAPDEETLATYSEALTRLFNLNDETTVETSRPTLVKGSKTNLA